MDRYELAWAAGFFDGEGWADLEVQDGRRTGQPMARVNQADPDGVPEVLLRFQRALGGLGTIGGPHREEGRIAAAPRSRGSTRASDTDNKRDRRTTTTADLYQST